MYRLKIISIGKVKESWLTAGIEEYTKRLKSTLSISWVLAKNNLELETLVKKEKSYGALDEKGKLLDSGQFALFLEKQWMQAGAQLTLVIGGADGLTEATRKGASFLISLSPLTFTHQLARLILLEQVYRSLEILKGSPYHRQ